MCDLEDWLCRLQLTFRARVLQSVYEGAQLSSRSQKVTHVE